MNKRIALLAAIAMAAIGYQSASAYTFTAANATGEDIYLYIEGVAKPGGCLVCGEFIRANETARYDKGGWDLGVCFNGLKVGRSKNSTRPIDVVWVDGAKMAEIGEAMDKFGSSIQEAGGQAATIENPYAQGAGAVAGAVGSLMSGVVSLYKISKCMNMDFVIYKENGVYKAAGSR